MARSMRLLVPTALGWKSVAFLLATTITFQAAPYNNLFFLLLMFLVVVATLVVHWTRQNLHGICGAVQDIQPAPAGSPHPARLQLRTRAKLRRGVKVLVHIEDRWHTLGALAAARTDIEWPGELEGMPRGVHQVTMTAMESTWPFGVLRKRAPIDGPQRVIAYPRPAELPKAGGRAAVLASLTGQPVTTGGDSSPTSLRPYREGEPLQRVHWKASARRQDLVLLDLDGEADHALEIVLDRRMPGEMDTDAGATRLERALSLATALILEESSGKHPFTLRSQDHEATYGPGQLPPREALAWLASVAALPAEAPAPPAGSSTALRLPLAQDAPTRVGPGKAVDSPEGGR